MAPVSNFERSLGLILLLIGVNVLGYFKDNFYEVILKFQSLFEDQEENSEDLDKFWAIVGSFNNGIPEQNYRSMQERVTTFLKFKWQADRNGFLSTKNDKYHMDQIPESVGIAIYKEFLFADFLMQFRRFLRFHKHKLTPADLFKLQEKVEPAIVSNRNQTIVMNRGALRLHEVDNEWIKFRTYPFFDWNDLPYQGFMLKLFKSLEPRIYVPKEIILGELEECQEMIFVTSERYDVGYEVNKVLKLRLTFGERTIIGAFNLCFGQRSMFIYKNGSKEMTGLAVRRRAWKNLVGDYAHF
jgi:hypothetical protein